MGVKAQLFNALLASQRASGVTLSGGKVYFYVPGSGTLKTIYADRDKQTTAANPFTLDSNGQASIYGDGLYDVQVKNNTESVSLPLWEDVSIVDISAAVDSVANYASLEAAVSAIGSTKTTLIVGTDQSVANNLAIPDTLELQIANGAVITVASGKTLTINSPFVYGRTTVFAGAGAVAGLATTYPQWWGAVSSATIQSAHDSLPSIGGTVDVGNAGSITLSASINVTKPASFKFGSSTLASNLATAQWLVKSSGVSFIGESAAVSHLTSTNTASGNIIQWGVLGETHLIDNLTVKNITFNLPTISAPIDGLRTTLSGVASIANNVSALSYIKNNLLVENCVFNEGANQIDLEQTYHATIRGNKFNTTKGRGIAVWNSDYGILDGNTLLDSVGTAINLNEMYGMWLTLTKGSDYWRITNNTVNGTQYEAILVRGRGTIATNNTVINARGTGISVADDSGNVNTALETIVSNNNIYVIGGGFGRYGMTVAHSVDPSIKEATNTLIEGNYIHMSGSDTLEGIAAVGESSANLTIMNNKIFSDGAATASSGIQIGVVPTIDIKNNIISGFDGRGIFLNGPNNITVTGNVIRNNGNMGIEFANTTNAFVDGNYMSANGALGLYVPTGNVNVQITDTNKFEGNVSGTSDPLIPARLPVPGATTYADNTAALAGGLTAGQTYRVTGSGTVAIVF